MPRTLYFLLFVLTPVLFFCQAPGYMGKKTVIGVGVFMNPVTYGATVNNKTFFGNDNGSAEKGFFRLNLAYSVFAERVISTKWLFGTSVNYIRTGYDNRSKITIPIYDRPTGYYQINAYSINPYFKKYSRRCPAPLGKYFMIGPSLNVIFTKHDNYMSLVQTIADGHDTLISDFGAQKQVHYSADLILGWGKSRIIKDKILVDYGCNFGVLSMVYVVESVNDGLIKGNPTRENYIDLTAKSRVRNATRFNVFVRVAYLF